ncbi:MAG: hypothetical protein KH152_10540, partial [Finegoldia magna]|nr:hypothetical protein [Finegoldia magna]
AASFAAAWSQDHPDEKLGLIPCAEGGSAIDEWAENQPLTRHALAEAKFAMETSELIAILWHQGENDSLNGYYKDYAEKLKAVFNHFRKELGLANLPIIVGELPDFLGKTGFGLIGKTFKTILSTFKIPLIVIIAASIIGLATANKMPITSIGLFPIIMIAIVACFFMAPNYLAKISNIYLDKFGSIRLNESVENSEI